MKNSPATSAGHRLPRFLVLLAALALAAAACSKADNTNNSNSTASNKNSTATVTNTSAPATGPAASPLAAYKAFQEANRKKDYEGVKKRFSKASLEMLTEEAKKENKTLDEYVKGQVDKAKSDEEVSNEKMSGDTGSVDIKDKDGKSSITLPMVKEDGEWKIAYDKFMQQLKDEFEKMGKELEKKSSNTNSGEHDEDDK